VVERIRRDAFNGDFDPVLQHHSYTPLAVTAATTQQPPTFLCQPGSLLRHQICGIFFKILIRHGIVEHKA